MQQLSPADLVVLATSSEVAIKLADEGVPVRAIARSIKIPSEDVYDLLKEAIQQGRILELPKDDWPPGTLRSSRAQDERDIFSLDYDILHSACNTIYKFTRLQSTVFLTLLRRTQVTKTQLHNAIESNRHETADPTDQKMVDVVICHIRRKLKAFALANGLAVPEIKTTWGVGYAMGVHDRDMVVAALKVALKDVQK